MRNWQRPSAIPSISIELITNEKRRILLVGAPLFPLYQNRCNFDNSKIFLVSPFILLFIAYRSATTYYHYLRKVFFLNNTLIYILFSFASDDLSASLLSLLSYPSLEYTIRKLSWPCPSIYIFILQFFHSHTSCLS